MRTLVKASVFRVPTAPPREPAKEPMYRVNFAGHHLDGAVARAAGCVRWVNGEARLPILVLGKTGVFLLPVARLEELR